MYTQVTCPNCGTPYSAEIHQLVDSKRTPELKQRLLDGSLNMAVCPNCGAGGQLTSILLFHDPDHEMFMVFVPQELNLDHVQREQMIGRLTQDVMESLPPEERRAYMLQPQIMLNMNTFMENVLETEGITKEMIARQQKQAELLNTLARADKDVQDHLLQERMSEIDETFFAMLQQYIDTAAQSPDGDQLIGLTNLRARLMTSTPVGRKLEKQQIAMHKLTQDAKKQDGLTPKLLAEHVVANQEDAEIVQGIVSAGQSALQYEFFSELSSAIEQAEAREDLVSAQRLINYRSQYLELYDSLQDASREMMEGALATLNLLLEAPDKETAIRENADKLDDALMYVLSARMAEADEKGNIAEFQALNEVQAAIVGMVESQMPPEVQFINALARAEDEAMVDQLLAENQEMVTPQLAQLLEQVIDQAAGQGQPELDNRLQAIKAKVQTKLLMAS